MTKIFLLHRQVNDGITRIKIYLLYFFVARNLTGGLNNKANAAASEMKQNV